MLTLLDTSESMRLSLNRNEDIGEGERVHSKELK